jgi:putative aldouronate transport system substrate-binding protein
VGGGAALVPVAALAAACGSGDGGSSSEPGSDAGRSTATESAMQSSGTSGGGLLPTYSAHDVVQADLPAADTGVPAGYFSYPKSPKRILAGTPTSGGSISMMKFITGALPPPVGSNPYWQELNKRVGAEMKFTNILNADYWQKLATTVAGGDLPDMAQFNGSSTVPAHLGDILQTKFQDLSAWVSGDNVKKYPNLAAIPTAAWRDVMFKGGIYGIPRPQWVTGNDNKIRQDIVDDLGLSADLSDGEDFMAFCKALSDPGKRRWACDGVPHALLMTGQMTGAPNGWKVEGGAFTSAYATDEYKQAIDLARQMWASGYIQPDSPTQYPTNIHTWFTNGTTVILNDSSGNWGTLTQAGRELSDKFEIGELILPKWEGGGQAAHYEVKGSWTFAGLKKASDDRVDELLRVLDWFATPFGSEEYLFINYGVPTRDYTLDGTDPVATPTGVTECANFLASYVASPVLPLYFPGDPDLARSMHDGLAKLMKVSAPLPTAGLVSETNQNKGASLAKVLTNVQNDIIYGRKNLSDWDGAVKTWLSNGGTAMGHEYEEALAEQAQ